MATAPHCDACLVAHNPQTHMSTSHDSTCNRARARGATWCRGPPPSGDVSPLQCIEHHGMARYAVVVPHRADDRRGVTAQANDPTAARGAEKGPVGAALP